MSDQADIKVLRECISQFTLYVNEETNQKLVEIYKNVLLSFVNLLEKKEGLDKSEYEKMLASANMGNVSLNSEGVVIDFLKYVEDNIINSKDKDVKEQYESLLVNLDVIIKDKDNVNEKEIEIWLKNYKEFVVNNEFNESLMLENVQNLFFKKGLSKEVVEKYTDFYNHIKIENPSKKDSQEQEAKKPEEKIDSPIPEENIEPKKDGVEPELSNAVEGDEPKKDEEEKNNEPLRIINVKYTKKEKAATIGSVLASWLIAPTTLPAILVANLGYKFYRKYKNKKTLSELSGSENTFNITSNSVNAFENFLAKNNFAVNDDGLLVDVSDKNNVFVITDETVEKERFKAIKKELLNIQNQTVQDDPKKTKFGFKYILNKFKSILSVGTTNKENEENVIKMGGR